MEIGCLNEGAYKQNGFHAFECAESSNQSKTTKQPCVFAPGARKIGCAKNTGHLENAGTQLMHYLKPWLNHESPSHQRASASPWGSRGPASTISGVDARFEGCVGTSWKKCRDAAGNAHVNCTTRIEKKYICKKQHTHIYIYPGLQKAF